MSAEQPISIGAELRQRLDNALETVVPGLRERRVRAELARRNLDSAYSQLGGEAGIDVTPEQVHAVLQAELEVLQTSFVQSPRPFINENFIKGALKFYTRNGLQDAATFMFVKADHWREIAHDQDLAESDSEKARESQRRAIACEKTRKLLDSMSFEIHSLDS